jgi:hypothetical protein
MIEPFRPDALDRMAPDLGEVPVHLPAGFFR